MRLIDADKLIEWLLGKKYINVDENSTEMSEEFGKEHLWELSRNCFIAKIIKYINSQPTAYDVDKVVEQVERSNNN